MQIMEGGSSSVVCQSADGDHHASFSHRTHTENTSPAQDVFERLRKAEERRSLLLSKRVAVAAADVLKSKETASKVAEERQRKKAAAREKLTERLSASAFRRHTTSVAKRLAAARAAAVGGHGVFDIDKGSPDADKCAKNGIQLVHVRHKPDCNVHTGDEKGEGTGCTCVADSLETLTASGAGVTGVLSAFPLSNNIDISTTNNNNRRTTSSSPEQELLSKRCILKRVDSGKSLKSQLSEVDEKLEQARRRRDEILSQIKTKSHLHSSAVNSVAILKETEDKRHAMTEKLSSLRKQRQVQQRRTQEVHARAAGARTHLQHVKAVATRVKAAKMIQTWARKHLNVQEVEGAAGRVAPNPMPEQPALQMEGALPSLQRRKNTSAAFTAKPLICSPRYKRIPASSMSSSDSGESTTRREAEAVKVEQTVAGGPTAAGSPNRTATDKVGHLLHSTVAMKNITQLAQLFHRNDAPANATEASRSRHRSASSHVAANQAGIQPLEASKMFHISFEDCAMQMQNRSLIAAAQVLVKIFEQVVGIWDTWVKPCRSCEGRCITHGLPEKSNISASPASAKTLLSSFMVAQFPEDVLVTESHAEDHQGPMHAPSETSEFHYRFVDSARDLIFSLKELCDAVMGEIKVEPAELAELCLRSVIAWSTYAEAFSAWKTGDGHRIANTLKPSFKQLVQKYEQYRAELDTPIGAEDAGLQELCHGTFLHIERLREQVTTLIGSDRFAVWQTETLGELKEARAASASVPTTAQRRPPSPLRSPTAALRRPQAQPAARKAPGRFSLAATRPPSVPRGPSASESTPGGPLHKMVMANRQLVHEMLLDPNFSLPVADVPAQLFCGDSEDVDAAGSSALEGLQQTAASMLHVKLAEDMGTEGYWQSRLFGDDADAAAHGVVAAIQSLVGGLSSLVPHKKSMHETFASVLDTELYANLARHHSMVLEEWCSVAKFAVAQIADLEAPARGPETRRWIDSFEGRSSAMDMHTQPTVEGRRLICRMLAFCHTKFAQVRMDAANVKLHVLSQFLHSYNRGIAYERGKFEELLGTPPLVPGTMGWREEALKRYRDERFEVDEIVTNEVNRRYLLAEGVLQLLECMQPLGMIASAASASARGAARVISNATNATNNGGEGSYVDIFFPETLSLDVSRMCEWQETLQRIVLLGTLVTVIQGIVAEASPVPAPAPASTAFGSSNEHESLSIDDYSLSEVAVDLYSFLGDSKLTFEELVACVIYRTNKLLKAQHKAPLALSTDISGPKLEITCCRANEMYVREAVGRALNPEHAVHKLLRKRCFSYLRAACLKLDSINGNQLPSQLWRLSVERDHVATCKRSVTAVGEEAISKLAAQIMRIVKHSDAVHAAIYSRPS